MSGLDVEVPARPATPDELVAVSTSAKGRTSRRRRPAAALAETAATRGWTVHGPLYARGPVTRGKRADEPTAAGKRPTIPVTTVEDTLGLRLSDPAGTQLAALWAGGKVEAWRWVDCDHPTGRCPRRADGAPDCNPRPIALDELKTTVEAGPRTEGEPPMPEAERDDGRGMQTAGDAVERLAEIEATEDYDVAGLDPGHAWVDGYVEGHAAAVDEHGDAYGEGYAAGVAAVSGHPKVWVPTRRRLDALRPGDVILGKGDRWWVVEHSESADARRWYVRARGGAAEPVEVVGDPKRTVTVVEAVALADALDALKGEGIRPARADVEAVSA